jgi:hypothetical protein
MLSSKLVILMAAALIVGATATASARPKKQSAAPSLPPTTACGGTPIIMQGLDCTMRPARGKEQKRATEYAERPHVPVRGSGGTYVAPLPRTPLLTSPSPSAPYVPPAVSNPGERVMQLNQSFPFYGGVGNNPSNRDAYIRYNLTR